MALVSNLISNQEFELALKILEKEENFDEKSAFCFSLLCRLNDEYEKESQMLDRRQYDNQYFENRRKWHAQPVFEKFVPRKTVVQDKNSSQRPKTETLEKLCFITCASKENFEWCVECLESVKQTRSYSETPVCVVDLGLTDEQKEYLFSQLKVTKIKSPVLEGLPEQLTKNIKFIANHNYMFFEEHCKDYEYVVHLETDTWIQDERGVDQLLCACEKQGFVWSRSMGIENDRWSWVFHYSFFAIKQGSVFWQHVKNVYKQELDYRLRNNLQVPYALPEQVLHDIHPQNKRFLLGDYNINYLDGPHNVPLFNVGIPVVNKNDTDKILRLPQTSEIVTSVHVQGNCPYIRQNDLHRFVYTRSFNQKPSDEDLAGHIQLSQGCLANGQNLLSETYNTQISLRFRVWPWADKDEIKGLLMNENMSANKV